MKSMKDFFGDTPAPMPSPHPARAFDGATYHAPRDYDRLNSQIDRVRAVMADGQWRTLRWITDKVGGSEASVSARLRDLRKAKHGGLRVDRECHGGGTWIYRVVK